jgi:hypothetical protein
MEEKLKGTIDEHAVMRKLLSAVFLTKNLYNGMIILNKFQSTTA